MTNEMESEMRDGEIKSKMKGIQICVKPNLVLFMCVCSGGGGGCQKSQLQLFLFFEIFEIWRNL